MAKKTQNVTVEMDDDVLVIRVDLSCEGEPSNSGKSMNLGTSHGNHSISDLVKAGTKLPDSVQKVSVGFNVYRKN